MTVAEPFTLTTAEQVCELLTTGHTTAEVAKLTKWQREHVTAVARKISGWLLDTETDKLYRPADIDTDTVPPSPPERLPYDGVPSTLLRAEAIDDDPAVTKALIRVQADLDRLRDTLADHDRRAELAAEKQRALDAITEAEQQLAAAKARAKELGATGKRGTTTSTAAGATPKQIRAWAHLERIDCPALGRVPKHVVAQYEAAHPTRPT